MKKKGNVDQVIEEKVVDLSCANCKGHGRIGVPICEVCEGTGLRK